MNCKERVITAAMMHKDTDMVPYNVSFTVAQLDKMKAFTGDENYAASLGNHIAGTAYGGNAVPMEGKDGYFKDDYGVVWNRTGADKDIGVIEGLCIPEPDMSLYTFPPVNEELIRRYIGIAQVHSDKFLHGGIGFSLFERAWTLRGMENLLMDMILNPDFVHQLMNAICEYNLKMIDIYLEYDVLDGMYFGDDWGQQKGLIMGPALWREFIKPYLTRMYQRVKSKGKYVLQHSCGDIEQIFPDLIDIGLDVYQTFQPEIYDIEKVKKQFGDRLSFWGGISTQTLLPMATAQRVKEETIRILKIMSQSGGYIAGPTHAVPGDVPPENIIAMVEVLQNQHLYL